MKRTFIVVLTMLALVMPVVSSAQTSSVDGGTGADNPKASNFQIVPCTGVVGVDGKGVACDFNSLIIMANRIIQFLFYISIPIVCGMILYTGFKYLTANGDPGKLGSAKKMLVPVALGVFWLAAGYIIIFTILNQFVDQKFVQDASNGPAQILGK